MITWWPLVVALKKGHVIPQRPNQVVVLSYDAVGRHCRYERNTHGTQLKSNAHQRFDVRVRVVVDQLEILAPESKEVLYVSD